MTTLKIAQLLMLLAALAVGVTTPIHNGQTLHAFVLLGGVLLIAHHGRPRAALELPGDHVRCNRVPAQQDITGRNRERRQRR